MINQSQIRSHLLTIWWRGSNDSTEYVKNNRSVLITINIIAIVVLFAIAVIGISMIVNRCNVTFVVVVRCDFNICCSQNDPMKYLSSDVSLTFLVLRMIL